MPMTNVSSAKKLVLLALVLILALLAFEAYTAIYPREAFYRTEFERIAETEVPSSAQFVFKDASFPDLHGDYTSCALFAVAAPDFVKLSKHFEDFQSQRARNSIGSDCLLRLTEAYGKPLLFVSQMREEDPDGEYRHWGLLDDGRSVMFHYVSW